MHRAAVAFSRQVAVRHRLAQVVMREAQTPTAFQQRIIQSIVDRRPGRRHQTRQAQDFLLRQARAARPEPLHRRTHPRSAAIPLDPLKNLLEQIVDRRAGQIIPKPLRQLLMHTKDTQLLRQRPQKQRIVRQRMRQRLGLKLRRQRFVVPGQVAPQQIAPLLRAQWLHLHTLPVTLAPHSVQHLTREGRHHQMEPLRQELRPPTQIAQLRQSIQGIDHDHPARVFLGGIGRRNRQPERQAFHQLLWFARDVLPAVRPPLDRLA